MTRSGKDEHPQNGDRGLYLSLGGRFTVLTEDSKFPSTLLFIDVLSDDTLRQH